jgi:hypothetical protein
VTGNYTQTTGGELSENWGSGQLLNVNGNAALSGYLVLGINPKRPPKAGSTDTFMTYGSFSGEFSSVTPGVSVTTTKTAPWRHTNKRGTATSVSKTPATRGARRQKVLQR